MNRSILSILSLAVAVSVGACHNSNNPRTKPVPGPTPAEEKKPTHRIASDEDAPPRKKIERDEVVDPTPAEKKKIPDAPVKSNPEYAPKSDKPGYVSSPYDPQHRLIDVRGLPPGTEAECPYTRRTFLVPP